MTSVPGIFACGNVAVVFDLVDYVSQSGEIAAKGAVAYMNGRLTGGEGTEYVHTVPAGNVNFIVPQKIVKGEECEVQLYMRVKHPDKKAVLEVSEDGQVTQTARHPFVAPPEMISCTVKATGNADVVVDMKEGK